MGVRISCPPHSSAAPPAIQIPGPPSISQHFPRNQGIAGESCALKDWYKCFTQSSKGGKDL